MRTVVLEWVLLRRWYLKTYDLLIHDAELINSVGNVIYLSFFEINHIGKGNFYNLVKSRYHGCCMIFNESLLNTCLYFPLKTSMHDSWIGNVVGGIKQIESKICFRNIN